MTEIPTPEPAPGPPPDPRVDRQEALARFLRAGSVVVFALAGLALVLPRDRRAAAAGALVGVLVAIPVIRVAWLAVRWVGRRDWRFVAAAVALLAVLGSGVLLR